MLNHESVAEQMSERTGAAFRPASPLELAKLAGLGLRGSFLDFYREFEPSEAVEGQIRLWPIEHILAENEALMPGCYSSRLGYIVVASTFCGDAYCIDITRGGDAEPPIVLLSHEVIDEHTSSEELARLAKPVARDFNDFLRQFIHGTIDEECLSP